MTVTTEPLRAENPAQACLERLQERIGPQKFNAWFRHGVTLSLEHRHVKLAVPNPFVANWIESHYLDDLGEAARVQTGHPHAVQVMVDPSLANDLRRHQLDSQAQLVEKAATGRLRSRQHAPATTVRHRLDDFVVGNANKLAYSAALAVAQGQKVAFNPLFIHGSCGVGKTHLLQGICNAASRRGGHVAWRYVTGEQFTNEFLAALRAKKVDDFRARYRKLDLLAIDDVHFLAAKKATQEEFLHTFNAIESAGRQIIMASDAHPHLVGELNAQLQSRFVAGMVVKIDAPDATMRMEILRRQAGRMKLRVPTDVMEFIVRHIRSSVRELEGTLTKLAALAGLENQPITLRLATEALSEHLVRTDNALTLGDIEAAVGSFFGMTPADLHSSRRTRTVSVARMVAMYLARRHTPMSYPEIARAMGKNHSSAVLAVQRMEQVVRKDESLCWMTPAGDKSMSARKLLELLTEQIQ